MRDEAATRWSFAPGIDGTVMRFSPVSHTCERVGDSSAMTFAASNSRSAWSSEPAAHTIHGDGSPESMRNQSAKAAASSVLWVGTMPSPAR